MNRVISKDMSRYISLQSEIKMPMKYSAVIDVSFVHHMESITKDPQALIL